MELVGLVELTTSGGHTSCVYINSSSLATGHSHRPILMPTYSETGTVISSVGLRILVYVFLRWVICIPLFVRAR